MTTLLAVAGFAVLFALVGLVPLRTGGGCGAGECGGCDGSACATDDGFEGRATERPEWRSGGSEA